MPIKLTLTACRATVRPVAFGLVFFNSFIRTGVIGFCLVANSVVLSIAGTDLRANSHFERILFSETSQKGPPVRTSQPLVGKSWP